MRRTIRLRESELRHIISESVKRVLNETRGYVPHDGNGMVGGYYGSDTFDAHAYILEKFLRALSSSIGSKFPEEIENFEDYCLDNEDVFTISGVVSSHYDESTGYGTREIPMYDLEDINSSEVEKFVMDYPTSNKEFKESAFRVLDNVINSLESDDFEIEYDY